MKIQIMHEPSGDEPFVVFRKERFIPTAPLKENDECALFQAADLFPEILSVKGRKPVEGGLIHRIDNDTDGLVLAATTQDFYDYMMDQQSQGRFTKTYAAVCQPNSAVQDGFDGNALDSFLKNSRTIHFNTDFPANILDEFLETVREKDVESQFRPFGRKNALVRPVSRFSGTAAKKKATGRSYRTEMLSAEKITYGGKKNFISVRCRLAEGYRHQVRCHLAWLGMPIFGDRLYNPAASDSDSFEFFAESLSFNYGGKEHLFSFDPFPV